MTIILCYGHGCLMSPSWVERRDCSKAISGTRRRESAVKLGGMCTSESRLLLLGASCRSRVSGSTAHARDLNKVALAGVLLQRLL